MHATLQFKYEFRGWNSFNEGGGGGGGGGGVENWNTPNYNLVVL